MLTPSFFKVEKKEWDSYACGSAARYNGTGEWISPNRVDGTRVPWRKPYVDDGVGN